MDDSRNAVLSVRDVHKVYDRGRSYRRDDPARYLKAVNGVSFDLFRGETLALVGESGCGKSSLANAILMLDPPTSGSVQFGGDELTGTSSKELRGVRRRLQVIFQDPYSSLNARMTVGRNVGEPLLVHGLCESKDERRDRIGQVLERVGLRSADADRYPHEFSGGQRQRIGIARALISEPEVVVCDEAVSALDVSIQAQVLNLLQDLQEEYELSYLFISHDLSVVGHLADRVAVMYLGQVVECGGVRGVFESPRHPYTQALLDAVPHRRRTGTTVPLTGDVPSPLAPPSGCAFHPRCPSAEARCREDAPTLDALRDGDVACHFPLDVQVAVGGGRTPA